MEGKRKLKNMKEQDTPAKNNHENLNIYNVVTFMERGAKTVGVFATTVYIAGYIVTASRLAQYGVPATELINAQYIVAGFLPAVFLWFMVFVVISALQYQPRKDDGDVKLSWTWTLRVFVILIIASFIIEVLSGVARDHWSQFIQVSLSASDNVIKIILGPLALWYLVAGVKSKELSQVIINLKKLGEGYKPVLWFVAFPLALVIIAFWRIPPTASDLYMSIPQSYGGGKPLQVQLSVDPTKVPAELLAGKLNAQENSAAYTIPLTLIYRTSKQYVLDTIQDDDRGPWILKADVVYAVVKNSR